MTPDPNALFLVPDSIASLADGQTPEAEVKRLLEVARQKKEGRTGGGPRCPWSDCGARALDPLEFDDRHQCRRCRRGARVRVTVDGLVVERVTIKPRERAAANVDPPALRILGRAPVVVQ